MIDKKSSFVLERVFVDQMQCRVKQSRDCPIVIF